VNIEVPQKGNHYIDEKWWHRFLRVLMYGSTCVALAITGFLLVDDSANYTYSYSYSFEPNYEQAEGVESTCSYHEGLNLLSCGGVNSLDDIIIRYRTVNESTSQGSNPRLTAKNDKEQSPLIDTIAKDRNLDEATRFHLLSQIDSSYEIVKDLKTGKIRYRQATHWNAGPLAQSVGLTFGIAILWYFVTLVIYKVILFIAYGHTRVRKTPV
jgi:hypothetical protein